MSTIYNLYLSLSFALMYDTNFHIHEYISKYSPKFNTYCRRGSEILHLNIHFANVKMRKTGKISYITFYPK